jgi:hypothetical protein
MTNDGDLTLGQTNALSTYQNQQSRFNLSIKWMTVETSGLHPLGLWDFFHSNILNTISPNRSDDHVYFAEPDQWSDLILTLIFSLLYLMAGT